jgi:serine/threonine-protein kinase
LVVDGTPFGRYTLVDLLGRGGMGEVWRAHDSVTERVVAIKMLPPQFTGDATFQQRFRREALAAARLNSPHVIPIYDFGEVDGRLYVSMRLIDGRDLHAVIADGPLAPSRAVRIIEQVAKALHAAHKVGLVHRDVKPSNVLIDEDDFAYLIDFGIARATDDTRLTSTGGTIGTLAYMAPERLGDNPDEDARADIYALACVLYECLTGSQPFPGSVERILLAHLQTPPPRPSTTQADVPATLDAVIATGMAKDPDHRYPTTIELATAAQNAITTHVARGNPAVKPQPQPQPAVQPARAPAPPQAWPPRYAAPPPQPVPYVTPAPRYAPQPPPVYAQGPVSPNTPRPKATPSKAIPFAVVGVIALVLIGGFVGFTALFGGSNDNAGSNHSASTNAAPGQAGGSDQAQIQQLVQTWTTDYNNKDLAGLQSLMCAGSVSDLPRDVFPQGDIRGTLSSTVKNIKITGNNASGDITSNWSSGSGNASTDTYAKESGTWKICHTTNF